LVYAQIFALTMLGTSLADAALSRFEEESW
jgi:hypothetical protein